MPYVFKHLEVYGLIKKWFHTILYHFNAYEVYFKT